MESTKKKILIVCSLMMAAALAVGGTLAYFFDQGTAVNSFTTAGGDDEDTGVDIDIEEEDWDPEDGKDVIPGDTIAKNPTVTNNAGDVYMRFVVELTDENGDTITDATRANKILYMIRYTNGEASKTSKYTSTQMANWPTVNPSFTLDTSRGSTGLYYYNYNTVMTKDDTATLFDFVIVPTDWTQTDLDIVGDAFNIVVTGQAIQAANMSSADEAFSALDDEVSNASSSSSSSSQN